MGALGAMDPDIRKFEDLDVWHPLYFRNLLVSPWISDAGKSSFETLLSFPAQSPI
jgi:hypothetical protein